MRPSYRKMALVGVGLAAAALAASASVVAGGAARLPAAFRGLASASLATDKRHPDAAPPEGYAENLPKFASMLDVLLAWNPDDPAEPAGGSKFDTLEVIDWATEGAMERATELRNLEIPFKIKNMPELDEVAKKWADDDYVIEGMSSRKSYTINTAHNGHFMFYQSNAMAKELKKSLRPANGYSSSKQASNAFKPRGYTFDHPPPVPLPMSFAKFWEESAALEEANKAKPPNEDAESRHLYLSTGDSWEGAGDTMISRDINLFEKDAPTRDLFIPEPTDVRGQHCRFGMRGVVAEQHWDGHRNFIYMLRGMKRYVINPPAACTAMDMMHSGPSRRHAGIDFSDPEAISDPETAAQLDKAQAVETVLRAGEILYMPSFWLHYIVEAKINDFRLPQAARWGRSKA
ncbi:hypothetical protein FNF31_04708 [Cafeteria roenbergensis]|uniref:Cupin-like domain-containing protein n=1 Tax=Cafeteria roenbergensis TaxID=33653 RepID=A0A5A8D2C5_CAFRO|nr:hypothetical protein FNF31_04708 [Cafeteria roenbergensis]